MRELFFSVLFFLLVASLSAQVGFSTSYRGNEPDNWKMVANSDEGTALLGEGLAFGIDYWFRLKEVRVEFLPELNFAQYEKSVDIPVPAETRANYLSFFFNTNIYFLDFFSDCDCPTWSKQSDFFQRGLYFQISPGVSRIDQTVDFLEQEQNTSAWSFSLGTGLGLDIGFSNLITLTPHIGVRYYFETSWEGLANINAGNKLWTVTSEDSALLQYYAGLRLGVRFYE